MRTKIVVVGLILLVVGVALIGVGASSLLTGTTIYRTFTQPSSGEYVSSEIVLNSTSIVDVRSPATSGGLIRASDLGEVGASSIGSYAIAYNSSAAGSDVYTSLRGDYYYVAFSSTSPSTTVVVVARSSHLAGLGVLVLVGLVCIIAGIVVAIVGAVKKGNKKSGAISDAEYYAKR